MKGLFRPDSDLMIFMGWVTDCIFLSLFFLAGCVPVVTAGASVAALYNAVYHGFRRGEKNTWLRFWDTFRDNWKGAIVPTLLFLAVGSGLWYGMIQLWNAAVYAKISWGIFAAVAMMGLVVAGMLSVLFPMLSRFENSLGTLVKNTVLLSLAHLPRTLLLGLINGGTVLLCALYIMPVFLVPMLAALFSCFLIEPMFRPYMPKEEEETEETEEAAE